ncbi:MAG: M14 family metallocarboxypeptidase, partial [Gallicola sp.]|nr:M14 family metallocarboxypeptidase [Gallicola sp.]
ILSILLAGNTLWAQFYEPKKVTEKFYPDPDININIPSLQKGRGFTSYNEMMHFLNNLVAAHPSVLNMKMAGKTQKGKEIPLIKISKGNDEDKIRIIYIARVHGDEPAGTEGMMYFVQQMAGNSQLQYLLDKISIYILPMLNIDGAETNTRRTANGIDMNRDQSKLETPEAQVLHHVINEVEPHVSVDYHEYQPVRSDFGKLSPDVLGTPWDVMFLFSGNPNVPQVIRTAVDSMFLPEAKKTLDANGLTHHNYYSSSNSYDNIRINVGGSSPRSTSNAIALKNTISMLMETRGIQLGSTALKRRTWSTYLLAETFAKTAYENDDEIRAILKAGLEDRSDVV